jgi:hypothetical protein
MLESKSSYVTTRAKDDHDEATVGMGLITLTIKRGELFQDRIITIIDRMDPYVSITPSWTHHTYCTLPCTNGHKTPSWSQQKHQALIKIRFPGANDWNRKMFLKISMWDKNRFSKDVLLGETNLAVMPLLRSRAYIRQTSSSSKVSSHTLTLKKKKVDNIPKKVIHKLASLGSMGSMTSLASIGSSHDETETTEEVPPQQTQSPSLMEAKDILKKTGALHIDFHFQQTEFDIETSNSRSGLGALLGVVSEASHAKGFDSNISSNCFVILPSSTFRRKWDLITMVGLFYVAVYTPVQITFLSNVQTTKNINEWLFIFFIDRCIDLIFLFDIIVNFRSAWETDDGVSTFSWKEAAWRYLTGWFLLDLISALPLDFLDLLASTNVSSSPTNQVSIEANASQASQIRILKLLRLFRLIKIAKVIRASRIFKRFEAEMSIKYAVLRLIKFGGVILVVSHWNACGFYLISTLSEGVAAETWAKQSGLEWGEESTPFIQYTASLYWAMMTLTTIGYGDIIATNIYERIYVIFMMMVSALVFAYVVGTMCSLVQGLNSQSLYFQGMIDDINDYMEMTHLPFNLRRRIRRYCLFRRDAAQHQNERQIWDFLSPSLRLEAALYQYLPILEQVPYFRETSSHFVSELACHLSQLVYGPNEVLINQGI